MKPPRITAWGEIPGTGCMAFGHPSDWGDITDFTGHAQEMDRVARWCLAEAKWARWKARNMKKRG